MSVANDILPRVDETSGTNVNYRKVTTWYDGSLIDDSKLDGDIYRKKDGEYWLKTISPDIIPKVDTIDNLRNYNGYYEGQSILLLGYYSPGDKEAVEYKFTVANYGSLVDDGGSVIKTDKGSWIAQFNNKASIKDFGAVDTQNIDNVVSKLLAADIDNIIFDKGSYRLSGTFAIELNSNKSITLDPESIIIKTAVASIQPFIRVNGDNTSITGGKLLVEGNSLHQGVINVVSGKNIKINNVKLENATIGIWVCPEAGNIVDDLNISGGEINLTKYGIILGKGVEGPIGSIEKVIIHNNRWRQGKVINEDGDGIKTTQRVKELIITNNFIDAPSRDCIDLFASGDRVIITDNIMTNALVKAVDIKREPAYDEAIYGVNGENIIISNNIISGMPIGIAISGNYEAANYKSNRFINVTGNVFSKLTNTAISASGRYINILGNNFVNNSYNPDTHYPTITVGTDFGSANTVTNNVNIHSNNFVNNCVSDTIKGPVIRIANYCNKISIIGNNIINDPDKERPYQDVGIYVNANSDVLVKDNNIDVVTRPLQSVTGSTVIGETKSLFLGTKPADKTGIIKLFKCSKGIQLTSADYSISVALPADATNYSTANILIVSATAINYNSITAIDTNINRKTPTTVFKANVNDDISVRLDKGGTGAEFKDFMITVNYIEY